MLSSQVLSLLEQEDRNCGPRVGEELHGAGGCAGVSGVENDAPTSPVSAGPGISGEGDGNQRARSRLTRAVPRERMVPLSMVDGW